MFHVALTRPGIQVVVLADADAPSPFVAELDGSRPPPAGRRGAPAGRRCPRDARRPAAGRRPGAVGRARSREVALRAWRSVGGP